MLFQHAASVTRRALTLSAISLLLVGAYSDAFAQEEKVFRWSSAGDFHTFDVHAQRVTQFRCQRRGLSPTS